MWQFNGLLDFVLHHFPPQHKETFLLMMTLKVQHRTLLFVTILTSSNLFSIKSQLFT